MRHQPSLHEHALGHRNGAPLRTWSRRTGGVVVAGRHPGSDVGFEGLDAAVVAPLKQSLVR